MKLLLLSICLLLSAVFAVASADRLPHGRAVAVGSVAVGMACVLPAATWMRGRLRRRTLRGRDELRIADVPEFPGRVYLGRGFEWTPTHATQLASEAARGAGGGAMHAVGIAEERDLCLNEQDLGNHLLILGTTGVGKTRMLEILITQAIRRGDAVAVIDPKGDAALLARVMDECARLGRKLDLVAPPYPHASVAYNPIACFTDPREVADRIAALLPAGGDAEPFRNFAWEIVEAVAAAMHRHDVPMTLERLRRFAVEDPWELPRRIIRSIAPELGGLESEKMAHRFTARRHAAEFPELLRLLTLNARPRDHAQKLASALTPAMAKLTSGTHRALLSPAAGGFSWDRLDRERGVAYFFLGSLLGGDSSAAVARMALLDFQSHVGRKFAVGSSDAPISLFVDELADAVSIPFVSLLNKGRGAGVRIAACAQTLADLEAALGSPVPARQILGNVSSIVQFRSPGREDADAFADLSGRRLLPTRTDGESYEPALFASGLRVADDFRAVFGRTTSWQEGALVPSWAITDLPRFEFFVTCGGRLGKGMAALMPPASRAGVAAIQEEAIHAHEPDGRRPADRCRPDRMGGPPEEHA